MCLNDCPTYRVLNDEADSPRGRIQLIRTLVSSPETPDPLLVDHLEACLVCRACETACPSGVPFGRIMEGAREVLAERVEKRGLSAALHRFGLSVVSNRARLAIATALTGLFVRSGLAWIVRHVAPKRFAWAASLAARPEGRSFTPVERSDGDIAFFAGCVMRQAFGETDRATVRVFEREGLRVTAPIEQVCCGALHAHAGEGEEARRLARLNIDAFGGAEMKIVVNAAGCGSHLKAYGDVLRDDLAWAERARLFAMRVRDASEVAKPAASRVERRVRIVYQDACHLAHGQHIRTQPRALLRAIEGVELLEIADAERCCGSAGIYNLTHPQVAAELQRQKVAAIIDVHPDVVVSANPGCMLQITAGLRRARSRVPVVHLMRFLDDPAAFA